MILRILSKITHGLMFSLAMTLVFGTVVLANGEAQIADPILKEKYIESAKELRCPTCTGLSVLDSDAEFSVQIKQQVKEQVEAGKTGEQIRQYFVDRYGPWILREPPKHGFNAFAWIFPIGILALGPIVLWILIWRRRKTVDTYGVRTSDAILVEFREHLARARQAENGGVR